LGVGEYNPDLAYILKVAPQIESWRHMMQTHPLFRLLDPFYYPNENIIRSCETLSPDTREWLTDQWLGIGLRGRKTLEIFLTSKVLSELHNSEIVHPSMLVLASGSGRHPLTALYRAKHYDGIETHAIFVDLDYRAGLCGKRLADDSGIIDVSFVSRDILHNKGFWQEQLDSIVARTIKDGRIPPFNFQKFKRASFDFVSVIGLLEYIPDDDWRFYLQHKMLGRELNLSAKKMGTISLLKKSWDTLCSGGFLLFETVNNRNPYKSVGYEGYSGNYQVDFCASVIGLQKMKTWNPFTVDAPALFEQDESATPLWLIERAGLDPAYIEIHRESSGFFDMYLLRKK
jgi:hypothetical protein